MISFNCLSLCLFVTVYFSRVHGHVFRMGECPTIETMKDFDINRFLGTWFVVQKFKTSSDCVTEEFAKIGKDYFVTENLEPIGVSLSIKGKVSFADGSRMKVSYPMSSALGDQDYQVMMTDYDSYAAVWSCKRFLFGHRQSGQIMSRKPSLDNQIVQKIRKRFESFGIDEHEFSIIDHSSCKWDRNGVPNGREKECTNCDALSFEVGPIKIQHKSK